MHDIWKMQYEGEIEWQILNEAKLGAVSDMRPHPKYCMFVLHE